MAQRLLLAVVLAGFFSPVACGFEVGDVVVVVRDTQLMVGGKPADPLRRGNIFAVQHVRGNWLWAALGRPGWVDGRTVTPLSQAEQHFTAAIRRNPRDVRAYFGRGRVHEWRQQWAPAIADYAQIVRLAPRDPLGYRSRAALERRQGQNDKALADYNRALLIDARHATTWCFRGLTWAAMANTAKALEDYNEAIRLDPANADFYNCRAWLRLMANENDIRDVAAALSDARKACELTSWNNCYCLDTLAAVYAEAGQFAEAVSSQGAAVRLAPSCCQQEFSDRLSMYTFGRSYRAADRGA